MQFVTKTLKIYGNIYTENHDIGNLVRSLIIVPFSALMLSTGGQEGHLAGHQLAAACNP